MSKVKLLRDFKFEPSELQVGGARMKVMLMHLRDPVGTVKTFAIPADAVADWLAIQQNVATQLGQPVASQPAKAN